MTLDRLSETGVGKAVNSLRNNPEHGSYALRIVEQWKSIARREGLEEKTTVKREPADSPEQPLKQEEQAEEELYTYGSDDDGQREEEEPNGYSYSYEVEDEEEPFDPDR